MKNSSEESIREDIYDVLGDRQLYPLATRGNRGSCGNLRDNGDSRIVHSSNTGVSPERSNLPDKGSRCNISGSDSNLCDDILVMRRIAVNEVTERHENSTALREWKTAVKRE
ncbi:hypothetical protein J6590_054521 [Homalodisca vitripennis]|nr:hypothetical protein J6590_054521 [Homalodisca vitripennis]